MISSQLECKPYKVKDQLCAAGFYIYACDWHMLETNKYKLHD